VNIFGTTHIWQKAKPEKQTTTIFPKNAEWWARERFVKC